MAIYNWTVGEKTYSMKIKTRDMEKLEKTLGCSLFALADGTIPSMQRMIDIINTAIQYDGLRTRDVTADIIDEWLDEGHSVPELLEVIVGIYKASGIIPEVSEEDDEKNAATEGNAES